MYRSHGAAVTLIGHHPERANLSVLKDVTFVSEENILHESTFNLVIEASGNLAGLDLALRLVKPRGTIILKSTMAGTSVSSLNPMVINEIRILGSRCGPFKHAMELLASGTIDPRSIIQAEYPLADGVKAVEAASRPGALKILLKM